MLSKEPIDLDKVKGEDIDKQILRLGLIAELDAINLYEQLAAKTGDKKIKALFLDIAREEKTHVGEFETLLYEKDPEQVSETEKGRQEIAEMEK